MNVKKYMIKYLYWKKVLFCINNYYLLGIRILVVVVCRNFCGFLYRIIEMGKSNRMLNKGKVMGCDWYLEGKVEVICRRLRKKYGNDISLLECKYDVLL